jgi:hypothetical protein
MNLNLESGEGYGELSIGVGTAWKLQLQPQVFLKIVFSKGLGLRDRILLFSKSSYSSALSFYKLYLVKFCVSSWFPFQQ